MPQTSYGDANISPRTNLYAAADMLMHAEPVMVLEKLAVTKQMPKNKTETIKFRRPRIFTAATTPLVEGVTPSSTSFQYEDVSATLKQYGQVVEITDKIEDLHEDPVLKDATLQAGQNIGRTIEALNYGIVRAGTSVYYANGTARTDVNTPITLAKQRAVIRALKSRRLGHLAIDVYEQESALFFQDLSGEIIDDEAFQRLMTFPNVLVTGHQGFFTVEALQEISAITLGNLQDFAAGRVCANRVEAA